MPVRRFATTSHLLLVVGLVTVAGCGAWKPAKHEMATVNAIDARMPIGISVADMRERFPDAERVEGDDSNGTWFIVVQDRCFWCTNKRAFVSTYDTYARIARFKDGALVDIDAVDTSGVSQ